MISEGGWPKRTARRHDSNRDNPGRARQTFINRPDWIRSTRTFHSSLFRTARFPVSPIHTLSPATSTSGHWPQPGGHSSTLKFSTSPWPPFWTLKPDLTSRCSRWARGLHLRWASARTRRSSPGTPANRTGCTSLPGTLRGFDACAHHSVGSATGSAPSKQFVEVIANFGKVCERPVEIGHLPAHEGPDVWARSPSRPPDGDDLPDLLQRESEPLCLPHEREQFQRPVVVDPITRQGATRLGKNSRRLIQPERLAARAAAPRYLTDQEAIRAHDRRVNPALRGKVKSLVLEPQLPKRPDRRRWRSTGSPLRNDRGPSRRECRARSPRLAI